MLAHKVRCSSVVFGIVRFLQEPGWETGLWKEDQTFVVLKQVSLNQTSKENNIIQLLVNLYVIYALQLMFTPVAHYVQAKFNY